MYIVQADIDGRVIKLIQMRAGRTLAETFDELEAEEREADVIIVRPPVEMQLEHEALVGAETFNNLRGKALAGADGPDREFGRVRDRPVQLLYSWDGQIALSPNINTSFVGADGITDPDSVDLLRAAELDAIVERSSALLAAPPGALFQVPSGSLVPHFLRVGNIQCDRDAIDAIFFWLLPHLSHAAAILIDTWSISSIAFHAAASAQAYFGGPRRRVEMLAGYHDGSAEASARATSTIERLLDDCGEVEGGLNEILVLISATQTGSLAGRLTTAFTETAAPRTARFVALFALGETSFDALRDLSADERYLLQPDVAATSVVIDPKVYFPLAYTDVTIEITKSDAEKHRQFFDRYAGANIISVHQDEDDGYGYRRHHHVFVDGLRIASHPSFLIRAAAKIAEWEFPLLVVAPTAPGPAAFGEAIANAFGARGREVPLVKRDNLFFQTPLSSDDNTLRASICNATAADEIIVALDISADSARLSRYERDLRNLGYLGRVNYLVGVERWPNTAQWVKFKRRLGRRSTAGDAHRVEAIESVCLPDDREDRCPWCAESALLDAWGRTIALPDRLRERQLRLRKERDVGLREAIFLSAESQPPSQLGPTSLFIVDQAGQSDVYGAAAAALQTMRSAPTGRPLLGRRRFPIATVLAHNEYLTDKWTDAVLRSALVRACHFEELTWTNTPAEETRADALAVLLTSQSPPDIEVFMEILLAIVMQKLPWPTAAGLRQALLATLGDESVEFVLGQID